MLITMKKQQKYPPLEYLDDSDTIEIEDIEDADESTKFNIQKQL